MINKPAEPGKHLNQLRWLVHILKPADYVVALLFISLGLAFSAHAMQQLPDSGMVQIRAGGQLWMYPLSGDLSLKPLLEEGTCTIEILAAQVRIIDSACPQQICIKMGSIPENGTWIACLPHELFISVSGSYESDEYSAAEVDAAVY